MDAERPDSSAHRPRRPAAYPRRQRRGGDAAPLCSLPRLVGTLRIRGVHRGRLQHQGARLLRRLAGFPDPLLQQLCRGGLRRQPPRPLPLISRATPTLRAPAFLQGPRLPRCRCRRRALRRGGGGAEQGAQSQQPRRESGLVGHSEAKPVAVMTRRRRCSWLWRRLLGALLPLAHYAHREAAPVRVVRVKPRRAAAATPQGPKQRRVTTPAPAPRSNRYSWVRRTYRKLGVRCSW